MLLSLLFAGLAAANIQSAPIPDLDRAELLSWMDPPSALQLLDTLQPAARSGDALVQWLMARGLAYAEGNEKVQAQSTIQRLHELGATQASAEAASHMVRSDLYAHDDQFDRAAAELNLIGAGTALPAFVRYRLEMLRGTAQTFRSEVALSTLGRALDLANAMHSTSRVAEANQRLADLYIRIGDLDRAASAVMQLRTTAQHTGDEALWSEVYLMDADIAEARGDHAQQRRALLEGLRHAQQGGGVITIELLLDLGLGYLETRAYAAALERSTQAMELARKLKRPLFERVARFDLGMAQIGLGQLASGKQLVDSTIQRSIASNDLYNADIMMRQYRTELEQVGDLRGALEVWRREDAVRDQLSNAREKALAELSAKFDNERRARKIELLERDNTIKGRNLQVQRLRQQMIVVATALIVLLCGALFWGITRIRKINSHLLNNTKHDALTGLLDRRYFNEQILARQGDRPYVGCLLLVAVDRLEHINDAVDYSAGDGVLSVVGKRLASTLRDSDALVRWASAVFLVMTGPMSDAELNLAARRLLIAIHGEPVTFNGASLECTVSIGYASFPPQGATVDISLDGAVTLVGKALRQAKRQGGDRACLITSVSANNLRDLSTINAQFEVAISDRRVQLVETVRTMA